MSSITWEWNFMQNIGLVLCNVIEESVKFGLDSISYLHITWHGIF